MVTKLTNGKIRNEKQHSVETQNYERDREREKNKLSEDELCIHDENLKIQMYVYGMNIKTNNDSKIY